MRFKSFHPHHLKLEVRSSLLTFFHRICGAVFGPNIASNKATFNA